MMITLDIPKEIIAEAEALAAARNITLQDLVVEGLRAVIGRVARSYDTEAALKRLRTGLHLGGEPILRTETHAR